MHVDVLRIDRHGDLYVLRISKGSGHYIRFIIMMYSYALNRLSNAGVGNSKTLFDGNEIYLPLTIRKDVEIEQYRNMLYIDTNEDNISVMLIDFERGFAILFKIEYDISRIKTVLGVLGEAFRERSIAHMLGTSFWPNMVLGRGTGLEIS